MKTTTTYTIAFCTFLFFCANIHAQPTNCVAGSEWTFNPPIPTSGFYNSGTTVEVCVQITDYFSPGAGWLWMMELHFPEPWDVSSIQSLSAPQACANGGVWLFSPGIICAGETYGPNYAYDVNSLGPQDGDPCNNLGDPCFGAAANWQFCFQITLGNGGSDIAALQGGNITPSLLMISDKANGIGDFPIPNPCDTLNFTSPSQAIFFNGCDANPGDGPENLPVCGIEPYCLFDALGGNPDSGGYWSGPEGWLVDDCGTFNPLTDPYGEYVYTNTGSEGCTFSNRIMVQPIDLGLQPSIAYCQSPSIALAALLVDQSPLSPGNWFFPDGSGPVAEGVINPSTDPAGIYAFRFSDGFQCDALFTMQVRLSNEGLSGETTTVDYCPSSGNFCPLSNMGGDPALGGSWILNDADGNFSGFFPISAVCISGQQLSSALGESIGNGFSLVYLIVAPPCAPSIDTLYVNYITPVNDFCTSVNGLAGINGNCGPTMASLEIYIEGSAIPYQTFSLIIDGDGGFQLGLELPFESTMVLKADGYLSAAIASVNLESGTNDINFGSLLGGDINGDNVVNILDVSLLNSSYGLALNDDNFNPLADLNCDGIVGLTDVSMLNVGYGLIGE